MATIRPETIIKGMHRQMKWDGCVPTFTGLSFNVLDPKPEAVVFDDVVQGLAYKFRFGGLIGPITVAEHCIMVSRIIEILWPKSGAVMPGLLHDSCEAYTHDIQSPVRSHIRVQLGNGELITWGDLERLLNTAVSKALWDGMDFYTYPEVQAADMLAAAIEKSCIASVKDEDWGLPPIPAAIAHLKSEFLSPAAAHRAFTLRYEEVINGEIKAGRVGHLAEQ